MQRGNSLTGTVDFLLVYCCPRPPSGDRVTGVRGYRGTSTRKLARVCVRKRTRKGEREACSLGDP